MILLKGKEVTCSRRKINRLRTESGAAKMKEIHRGGHRINTSGKMIRIFAQFGSQG